MVWLKVVECNDECWWEMKIGRRKEGSRREGRCSQSTPPRPPHHTSPLLHSSTAGRNGVINEIISRTLPNRASWSAGIHGSAWCQRRGGAVTLQFMLPRLVHLLLLAIPSSWLSSPRRTQPTSSLVPTPHDSRIPLSRVKRLRPSARSRDASGHLGLRGGHLLLARHGRPVRLDANYPVLVRHAWGEGLGRAGGGELARGKDGGDCVLALVNGQ